MQINTTDGMRNVTSQSQGNLNTFLGAAGTFLGLANGGANMLGWGNRGRYGDGYGNNGYGFNGYFNNFDPNSRLITKAEFDLGTENTTLKAELALQRSENYTDKKIVEATTYLDTKIGKLEDKVDIIKDQQQHINAQQMAYNAAANASIDVLKSQIANLATITKVYVPEGNVCHQGCGCGCNA